MDKKEQKSKDGDSFHHIITSFGTWIAAGIVLLIFIIKSHIN